MHDEAGVAVEPEGHPLHRAANATRTWLSSSYLAAATLLVLTLAIFAPVLFASGDLVLSKIGTDLDGEFVYWRQFGFDQLRAGHLALWDPHVYSGVPFMGGFQADLLYPPNLIYLVLPLHTAINCEIALHVFLLGIFTMVWLRRFELHPLAILLACSVSMFSGPFFFHIYPGHLATIDSMAWTPLIYLTIEKLVRAPEQKWVLVGVFVVAMQLLAGYPQTFFSTMLTGAIYGAILLWKGSHRARTLVAIAIVGIGAIGLTAVQIWTGLNAAAEGTRQGGVPFAFAAMFSFPPENFLTLLIPGFFGNMTDFAYWGRCYLWEMSAFIGVTGFTMAGYGATLKFPGRGVYLAMIAIIALLAVGSHTPLFALFYHIVPGFDHFRAHSKFLVQAVPFVAVLIGIGTTRVMTSSEGTRRLAIIALLGALIVGATGLCLLYVPRLPLIRGAWEALMQAVLGTRESYLRADNYTSEDFTSRAASFAGSQCVISAAVLLAIALLLYGRAYHRGAAWALVILGIGEMLWFANSSLASFSLADTVPTEVADFLATRPGDYRILELPYQSNGAISIGAYDIWGYDPIVLRRYAEFMTYSQGGDLDNADMYVSFHQSSPLFRLLRTKYVFRNRLPVGEIKDPLPHLLLLGGWAKETNRNEALASMNSASFEPDRLAILESDPVPAPVDGADAPGTAEIVKSDTDSLTIAAHLTRPSLLLVTDCYSRYFRAVAAPGSAQNRYRVMPADYTLMAIPLGAGDHSFRLEYAPPGFFIGRWISLFSAIVYLLAVAVVVKRSRELPG